MTDDWQPYEYLRSLAGHFARGDWEWTRDLDGMTHIRYQGDWTGYNHPIRRLWRTARRLTTKDNMLGGIFRPRKGEWLPWARAVVIVGMRTDNHLPDGRLGSIICHWEEDGEYIQVVQPSVGLLLADFLEHYPEHPSAVAITNEIRRIAENYTKRAGERDDLAI